LSFPFGGSARNFGLSLEPLHGEGANYSSRAQADAQIMAVSNRFGFRFFDKAVPTTGRNNQRNISDPIAFF